MIGKFYMTRLINLTLLWVYICLLEYYVEGGKKYPLRHAMRCVSHVYEKRSRSPGERTGPLYRDLLFFSAA